MAIGAVITADIVNSTLFTAVEEKKFMNRIQAILKRYLFEFYRGDSFQVLIKDPIVALRTVLIIRLEARKMSVNYDVRSGIGIGEVNPKIKKLNTATDPAFVLSGRAFDTLSSSKQRLAISCLEEKVNHGLNVISYFLDYLMQNLTEKQAEVISELLLDNTQTGAAKKLNKSPSTINKHAQAAGWDEISKLFDEYAKLISIL
jgi:hypothetical protein